MITSTDGQSPYSALVTGSRTHPPTELALTPPPADDAESDSAFNFFGEDGFTFGDLIDVINPLQHIPLVSTMYREASNDTIDAGPRIMGSTLFFGPIGLATAVANVLVEEGTGQDIGAHVADAFWSDDTEDSSETEIAEVAAFETAAGANEDVDPVSAWAANEMAWRREQQEDKRQPIKLTTQGTPGTSEEIPDANAFLQPSFDQLASANPRLVAEAAQNASWAYETAADLALNGS